MKAQTGEQLIANAEELIAWAIWIEQKTRVFTKWNPVKELPARLTRQGGALKSPHTDCCERAYSTMLIGSS